MDFSQIEIQIFNLKYLTHNIELYIKQKLLKNAIWRSNIQILAKWKIFYKWDVCHFFLDTKLFKFARTKVAN